MMRKTHDRVLAVVAPLLVLASASLAGCEVIAEFDRTLIDAGEAPFDAAATDSTLPDVQADTATDAPAEANGDAGGDTAPPADASEASATDAADAAPADTGTPDTGAE